MKRRSWIILAVIVAVVAAFFIWKRLNPPPVVDPYKTQVLARGDRDVEHGLGPLLRHGGDLAELAVAHDHHLAFDGAQLGDPQGHLLDDAFDAVGLAGLGEPDLVAVPADVFDRSRHSFGTDDDVLLVHDARLPRRIVTSDDYY